MSNTTEVHGSQSAADAVPAAPSAGTPAVAGSAETTADNWAVNAGGDWKDAADWSTGQVPGSGNDAVISTATLQTITYTSADRSTVNSLTVGQDIFAMSGGSLTILTSASFADGLQQSGGTLQGGAMSLSAASNLTGGSITGSASLNNSGTATLSAYAIDAAASLTNTGTIMQTGAIALGSGAGTGAAILNDAGMFDLTANVDITARIAAVSFTNDALLEKSGATGTSVISADFTNAATGTISALAGNLEFTGKTTAFDGTLDGPAEISVGAGVLTIAGGTSIDAGTFGILGKTSVNLAGSVSVANLFDEAAAGNTSINVGSFALTLTGAATAAGTGGTEVLTGSGSVVNAGSLTVSGSMSVGKTLSFINDGMVLDSGNFGLGSGSAAPALINAAGATFDLERDAGLGVLNGAAFSNAGTLAKISGNGMSTLSDNVTSSGVIDSEAGTLDFSGSKNAFGGTLTGAGAVALAGSSVTTLEAGLVLSVATLDLYYQATLVLAAAQSFAGTFVDDSSVSGIGIDLSHFQLSLSGAATFGGYQAVVYGPGTLSTSGTTKLSGDGLTLDGNISWQNSGTVLGQAALALIGGGTVKVVNAKSGLFYVNDNFSVTVGASATAYFTNAGLFEQTGTTGLVSVGVDFTNTGRIVSSTGTIDFTAAANAIGGTVGGAGAIEFDSGSLATLEAGVSLLVGTIDLNSATLALAANASYSKTFNAIGSPTLSLGDYTLTLAGATSLDTISIGGSGTLVTSGTTTLGGQRSHLVGTAEWINTGTFDNQSNLDLGDGSGDITQFVNAAGGVYESGTSIDPNSESSSSFTNAGTFEVLPNGGAYSIMGANFSNTGSIDVTSGGTLQLTGPTTTLGGTLTGAGTVLFLNDVTWQFSASATVSVQSMTFGLADLTLASSAVVSGQFNVDCGEDTQDVINLNGYALELLNATDFGGADFGVPSVTVDDGSLTTFGSTTVEIPTVLGATDWTNYGTISLNDRISFNNNANIINTVGGVFDIEASGSFLQAGSPLSQVLNDGLFEQTSGTGTTTIPTQVINNGTLTVTAGTIEIPGVQQPNGTWVSNYSGDGAINGLTEYDSHMDLFISAPSSQAGAPVQRAPVAIAAGSDNATIAATPANHPAVTTARFIGTAETTHPLPFDDVPWGLEAMGHLAAGLLTAASSTAHQAQATHTDLPAGALSIFMTPPSGLSHPVTPGTWHSQFWR